MRLVDFKEHLRLVKMIEMRIRHFIFSSVAFLSMIAAVSCEPAKQGADEYTPIALFAPAYNSLQPGADTCVYDLNATIRVIRALDLAYSSSDSFETFLELLSKQDYRLVAPEVVEAEKKLFPVLQKLYLKGQEMDKMNAVWTLVQMTESTLSGLGDDFLSDGKFDLIGVLRKQSLFSVVNDTFDRFAKTQKIKAEAKQEFNGIKAEYYAVIQETWPVFLKYREEWERLCIKKDEAYLDVYSGGTVNSYNIAGEILESYQEDREGLLLKALSIVNRTELGYDAIIEAQAILDRYIELYPTQTAPAYLIKGIIASKEGNQDDAFSYFDHSAIEYPRQAAALTDMLDAYVNRPYFSKTREGLYFQQMYRSTLEGFGFFSPNFQKALYYDKVGMKAEAAKEIYNHFFRRQNQDVYDYLLSDMEFCENYLNESFSFAFPESRDIDLVVKPSGWLSGSHLRTALINNSGKDLMNVRCFLCLHLTGMYPGDYVMEKLPPVNVIPAGEKCRWRVTGYKPSDIVSTRAIVMTDTDIFWADSRETKRTREPAEPADSTVLSIPAEH